MTDFYENLSHEAAAVLDGLARLLLELRDSRAQLLARHSVTDETELLERIRSGALPGHPAYEDYLGIRCLVLTRERVRSELRDHMLTMERP